MRNLEQVGGMIAVALLAAMVGLWMFAVIKTVPSNGWLEGKWSQNEPVNPQTQVQAPWRTDYLQSLTQSHY